MCPGWFEPVGVSWRQDAELRATGRQRALGPQWPTVEQPSQDEKEMLLWSREELGVKITVCPRLQLISHTQPSSTQSRIKCKRYIFIKKCVRSFIKVRILCLIMFLLIFVYVYVRGYSIESRPYHVCRTLLSYHVIVCCHLRRGWPRGEMVKAMDCGIVVSDSELQSYYYVQFRTNTLGKILPSLVWVK